MCDLDTKTNSIFNMPPTTLASLPLVIRSKIFKELLSVNNNPFLYTYPHKPSGLRAGPLYPWSDSEDYHRVVIGSSTPTELFTINKQLSAEALDVFHWENVQVIISVDCDRPLDCVKTIIPMVTESKNGDVETIIRQAALHIELRSSSLVSRTPAFGVISGRYLPTFVQLVNSLHSPFRRTYGATIILDDVQPIPEIDKILFKFNTLKEMSSPGRRQKIADALKGLRQYYTDGLFDTGAGLQPLPPTQALRRREIVI